MLINTMKIKAIIANNDDRFVKIEMLAFGN